MNSSTLIISIHGHIFSKSITCLRVLQLAFVFLLLHNLLCNQDPLPFQCFGNMHDPRLLDIYIPNYMQKEGEKGMN